MVTRDRPEVNVSGVVVSFQFRGHVSDCSSIAPPRLKAWATRHPSNGERRLRALGGACTFDKMGSIVEGMGGDLTVSVFFSGVLVGF